jgi:tyrosine-protein phosphatase SIW14
MFERLFTIYHYGTVVKMNKQALEATKSHCLLTRNKLTRTHRFASNCKEEAFQLLRWSRQTMSKLRRALLAIFAMSLPAMGETPAPGIANFHKVNAYVYRGAQPTVEGFKYVAKLGVKTVLDLREADGNAAEVALVTALGMHYVNVPMTALTPPTKAQITKILALLEDPMSGGVFVHCRRGADRTGVVIAAYRIDHDHWNNSRALKEAMSCGMSFFQLPRQSYIRHFQPRTDGQNAQTASGHPDAGKVQATGLATTILNTQP